MPTRPLSHHETIEARRVFADSIPLGRVQIWERSWLAQAGRWQNPGRHMGVTVFHTIHFSRVINTGTRQRSSRRAVSDMGWLIHELTHVWQYRHFGIVTAPRALHAQFLGDGYEYGGSANLIGKQLDDFNLEQQGRIAEHYYIKLVTGDDDDLHHYEPLIDELRSPARAPDGSG